MFLKYCLLPFTMAKSCDSFSVGDCYVEKGPHLSRKTEASKAFQKRNGGLNAME